MKSLIHVEQFLCIKYFFVLLWDFIAFSILYKILGKIFVVKGNPQTLSHNVIKQFQLVTDDVNNVTR